ncbi:MAG: hypothetical protein HQM14_21880 [SAR324 cluster bacterium]|nr:hypothetical protein [SAR324 cluster bacterium]
MTFRLLFTDVAKEQLDSLANDSSRLPAYKAALKTLGLMETNLRHPSLQTHEFTSLKGPNGEKVYEAYVQHKTPGAYRIFWYYGPEKGYLTIAAIVPHP